MFKLFFKYAIKAVKLINKVSKILIDDATKTIIYSGITMLITKFLYNLFQNLSAVCV